MSAVFFEAAKRLFMGGAGFLAASTFQYLSESHQTQDLQHVAEYAMFAIAAQGVAGLISNLAASQVGDLKGALKVERQRGRNDLIRHGMAMALLAALHNARKQTELCQPSELYSELFEVWFGQLKAAKPGSLKLQDLFPLDIAEIQWQAVTRYDARYDKERLAAMEEEIRAGYEAEAEQDAAALADLLWSLTVDPVAEPLTLLSDHLRLKWDIESARHFAREILPLYRVEFAKIFSAGGSTSEAIGYKGMTLALEMLDNLTKKADKTQEGIEQILEVVHTLRPPAASEFETNMPHRRPQQFMGRDEALSEMEQALKHHSVIALVGMRGSGKSTAAIAYADRHRADYRAIWWLRAETEDGMSADLLALGVRFGWVRPAENEAIPVATVLERLVSEGDRILLIYDNAINADIIYPYLPRGGSAQVLITSNAHVWRGRAEPIEILVWPKQVGADYLLARLTPIAAESERRVAEALSEKLGGLPLALEVAAAYCEHLEMPLADFHRRFDESISVVLSGPSPPEFHNRLTVESAFSLAIGEAAKLHPAAEPLIEHFAVLAAEPIPLFLFVEGRTSLEEPLASMLADDGLYKALAALRAFALIDRETILDELNPSVSTPSIRLHRLVREVAAARCTGTSSQATVAALIKAVAAVYPNDDYLDLLTNWPRARRLDALAFALIGDGEVLPAGSDGHASDLMVKVASYRHACTPAYAQVRALLDRALAIRKSTQGPEGPGVAEILNKLGLLSWAQGDLSEARLLCEEALDIRKKVLDPNDPAIGHNHVNLARILLDQGDIASARIHSVSALAIFEARYGRLHPDVATSLTLLGHIDDDDLSSTQLRFEEAKYIFETKLGPDHPATATSLLNLAEVLERQGELAAARQYIERALAIHKKTTGPDSRLVAYSLFRLANVLQGQNEVTTTRLALQAALAINEKWYEPDNPKCASLRKRLQDLTE
jgi:tetratricopeptide (TPR) repeat protein